MKTIPIDTHPFGQTGREVSIVGLGGEGVLRTFGQEKKAEEVILEAIAQGITYFDCARVYAGSEGYYGRVWPKHAKARAKVFQASKSASRDKKGALGDLDKTLATMGIDHLDLWQIHDVRTQEDIERIAGPNGALEAFVAAKKSGQIRHIGVTGHYDPEILTRAVREWPVDSVLLPVNPVEAVLGGFLDQTLPAAKKKGIAVIAMKILGASHYIAADGGITPELLLRFALSQDITVAIVGCSTPEHVQTLAETGKKFQPLSKEEQAELIEAFRPQATELAYYRGVQ
jgi:aryl-alcohol dehydrogenase-like predicted oxidoreductase